MDTKDKEFLNRLRATFRIEAEEHISAISAGLIELEKKPGNERLSELIEIIFRETHSLKGAARSVDLRDIEAVCQPLEEAFSSLKRREIELTHGMCDLFHHALNVISQHILTKDDGQMSVNRSGVRELIKQLANVPLSAAQPEKEWESEHDIEKTIKSVSDTPPIIEDQKKTRKKISEKQIRVETVRIPTARLDPIFLQAEEMILVKMAAAQRVRELTEIDRTLIDWKAESIKWKKRPSITERRRSEKIQNGNEMNLNTLQSRIAAVTIAAYQDFNMLKRIVDDHIESMKQVMMLPVSSLVEAFPKIVRDLGRDQNKDVELIIRGAEIEIDKRILDELKDPLIHLLRNSVDHGIKKPEERVILKKLSKGTINLFFKIKDGRQLEILVSDDGEGINEEQVLEAAIKAGIAAQYTDEKTGDTEMLSIIFKSGITTSPIITDISGRGLGLAIVKEKVEKLGGVVYVETHPGLGTTFRLVMPLTLATFRGVLVRVNEHMFVLPTLNVEKAVRISRDDIRTVENRETIQLNGQIISLVSLSVVLELPVNNKTSSENIPVVVIVSGNMRIAFQVDEILNEMQVLVKGFGRQLLRVRNIAGATVLGTGRVVPILNIQDLIKSAVMFSATVKPSETLKMETAKKKEILVAEDSITSRTLIRNILETAGYSVVTAVDGLDALTHILSDKFDLVVSDVDMPRMNGFELTVKIRNDKKLGDLPVVLVTGLESREDREHGIEAGANAYIVKSSFDQSNLLEVVKRFI